MLTLKENETGPYIEFNPEVSKIYVDRFGMMYIYIWESFIPQMTIEPQGIIRNEKFGVQFILQDLVIEAAEKQEVAIERE